MIEIGNTIINTIFVGSTTPNKIDVGSTQVWPDGEPTSYYITLTPSQVQPWNGSYRTGTISVSSNTQDWTAEASMQPASATPYFRVSKTNNTTMTWVMDENFSTTSRIGHAIARYGSVSAETLVYQNAGYYIYIEGGTSPRVATSGGGTVVISVISNYGNTPVAVTSASTKDWIECTNMTDAGSGRYVFTFQVPANPTTGSRNTTLTFTQQAASSKSVQIMVSQYGKYVPQSISGFTIAPVGGATYGDWAVGRFLNSYQDIGGVNTPIYTIAILKATPVTATCEASFTVNYQTITRDTPQYYTATGPRTIYTTSTVSIPSGDTAYGITIGGGPNAYITGVSNFSVI